MRFPSWTSIQTLVLYAVGCGSAFLNGSLFDPALGDIDPLLGWGSLAADGVERYELEGEHVTILREPFVRAVGERLRQCLNREQLAAAIDRRRSR